MNQIAIHLENISLDNKLSGTLKCYVQIDKSQTNFSQNSRESRFETVIVKGKLIIPEKIQIKLISNEKTAELSQLNQKIFIWFTFQSSNIQPNPIKIHETQLQISSLRLKDVHMLQYLETKYGRGSMVKYSIKLEKKSRYQKNVPETTASSAENQANDQLISERIKMKSSDNKYKSWKETSRIKKQNNEKINNEKKINEEQINNYKLKQKNLIKNQNQNIESNKKLKNYQIKQKQILNNQQHLNNQLIKQLIQKQYKVKLRAIQNKSVKLQLKIKQLQAHNEQLLRQNIQSQKTVQSYKQIIMNKDKKIKRMNETIQKLESNTRIKQGMLRQQIEKKINKIKQLQQQNSDNKITVSRLKDDLTQKQRKYSFQVNRLKELVEYTVKQKRNSRQLAQNNKQDIKNNKDEISNSCKCIKQKQRSIKTKPQSIKKYFAASQESISEMSQQESYKIKQSNKKYQSQYIADKQQCIQQSYSHLKQQLQIHSISTIYLQDIQESVNLDKKGINKCQEDSFYMDIIVKQDSMRDIIKRQKNNLNILTQSNYNLAQQLQRKNKIISELNDKIKKLQLKVLIQNKK